MSEPVLVEIAECASTQELAAALFGSGQLPLWGGVMARTQTAGRGRRGRRWTVGQGSLALSVVLPIPASAQELGLLPLRVALAVLDACGSSSLQVKWPNDIVVTLPRPTPRAAGLQTQPAGVRQRAGRSGSVDVPGWGSLRKLGGILCEVKEAGTPRPVNAGDATAGAIGAAGVEPARVVVAGIGLNLAPFCDQPARQAPSWPGEGGDRANPGTQEPEQMAPVPWAMSAARAAHLVDDPQLAHLANLNPAELASQILRALPGAVGMPAVEARELYTARCATIGQEVEVRLDAAGQVGPGDVTGLASGIGVNGSLIVLTAQGTQEVVAGDVSVRRA